MSDENRQAASAHERVMMNLSIFHLLLPVAALSSGYITPFLISSLVGSVIMLFFIARRAKQGQESELIVKHWQLAWKRCKLLLIGYGASIAVMLLGFAFSVLQPDPNMSSIMLVVFSRIAAVPIIVVVMVLFVLSSSSLAQARQGLLPD